MSADYVTHDFRPAPAGWRVSLTYQGEDGGAVHEVHPLAGWEVQVWAEPDGYGGHHRDESARRIEPAVWLDTDGLVTVAELTRQGCKVAVTGPAPA